MHVVVAHVFPCHLCERFHDLAPEAIFATTVVQITVGFPKDEFAGVEFWAVGGQKKRRDACSRKQGGQVV